jgi:ribosomal protein S18 acetylase RimI-like enzyme
MVIRPATTLDLPAIAQLHISVAAELRNLAPEGFGTSPDNLPGRGDVAGTFRDTLDDSDAVLLVAEVDGRLVALASGWQENTADELFDAPFFTVEYVEVAEEYRGQGLASQLLEALEAEARRRGITQLDLRVMVGNEAARSLYERVGYQTLELRMGKVLS